MKHCRNYNDRKKNTELTEHNLLLLLCPLQIPHGLAGIWPSTVRGQQLPTSAMAWPKSSMNTHEIVWAHICGHTYTHMHMQTQ
jgi:hypothetical protein